MLLSRNTYAVYWMSRYMERAENIVRFIDVNFHRLMDMRGPSPDDWSPFIAITGDEELFYERYAAATKPNVLQFLVSDPDYGNSILSCLELARQNALQVRDIITSEMWELINRAYLFFKDLAQFPVSDAYAFFYQLKNFNRQYLGVMDATLSRDEVWQFCRLGHFVERADKTSRILDVRSRTHQGIPWVAVLKSVEALDMYRKSWRLIHPHSVVRFLLMDVAFPRSVLHCVMQMENILQDIVHGTAGAPHLICVRQLRALKTWLHAEAASDFVENHLHEAIDELQGLLNHFDNALHEEFFGLPMTGVVPLHRPSMDASATQGGMAQ